MNDWRHALRALLHGSASCMALLCPLAAHAEVATDGSLGRRVTLRGGQIEVGADLGETHGTNLFHSFQRFNIDTGGRVTFTGPDGLRNVISRVTGGERSSIDGTLASAIPGADFYLLNPAGVLFGPNARLDVKGAFHASTADELRFADGAVFSALDIAGSTLSVAEPEAFGFLGRQPPGAIDVNQSVLTVPTGEALSLVGGDVTIKGGPEGFIEAEAGRINLGALGGPGATNVRTGELSGGPLADIRLTDVAEVRTSGDGGGAIHIRGGQLVIEDNSRVVADNTGSTPAPSGITIDAGSVTVALGSQVTADALASGDAGTVAVKVEDLLEINEEGEIASTTFATGDAGAVTVGAGQLRITGGPGAGFTGISSTANPDSSGGAGTVAVKVEDLLEIREGAIASNTLATGDAGAVTVEAGQLHITGGSGTRPITGIFSNTLARGDAGAVTVEAGQLHITGSPGTGSISGISSSTLATGDAGAVTVGAGQLLEIREDGEIASYTLATGDAGAVTVGAGQLRITGVPGAGVPGVKSFTGIRSTANPDSSGDAGTVAVKVEDLLEISDQGAIASSTLATGDAGVMTVEAGQLRITGVPGAEFITGISSNAEPDSSGDAGTVTVKVEDLLEINEEGAISSSTFATGDAGAVTVGAGQLRITGGPGAGFTGISSNANPDSSGGAGTVAVKVEELLEINEEGAIASNTFATGAAGVVTIEAGQLRIAGVPGAEFITGISSNANERSSGGAGTVAVKVEDLLEISDQGAIASNTFATGDAGAVTVEAGQLRITGGPGAGFTGISSNAEPDSSGDAGTVAVKVEELLEISDQGEIASNTSATGDAGAVTVEAGQLRIAGGPGAGFTGISSNANPDSSGDAGTVAVKVEDLLEISDQGEIASSTFATGDAGAVTVEAGQLRIAGGPGAGFTGISSNANPASSGDAGTVAVKVEDLLEISDQGEIGTNTFATGAAGAVTVEAGQLRITGGPGANSFTGISSDATESSSGNAGTVTVDVSNLLEISDQGAIGSNTFATGDAGAVTVEAGQLRITGGPGLFTGIASNATESSSGNAGTVTVDVSHRLEIHEEGEIASSGLGKGRAGDVHVAAGTLLVDDAAVRTVGTGAEGGRITVEADDLIHLIDAEVTSSGIVPAAGASLITLRADTIVLNASRVESLTGSGAPLAGSGEASLLGDVTVISADSFVAGSSSVEISGLQTNLGSDLQLPTNVFLDASRLLRDSCAAAGGGPRSSFTRGGRGGLPPSPDRALPSAGAATPGSERVGAVGSLVLDACAGTLMQEAKS